jgi:hypothetical protein
VLGDGSRRFEVIRHGIKQKSAFWRFFHGETFDRPSPGKFMQMLLMFKKLNEQVVSVHLSDGELVGQLKLIGGMWKFKAVGYTAEGHVVPGAGPLTDRHNMTFAVLDEAAVTAGLVGR